MKLFSISLFISAWIAGFFSMQAWINYCFHGYELADKQIGVCLAGLAIILTGVSAWLWDKQT